MPYVQLDIDLRLHRKFKKLVRRTARADRSQDENELLTEARLGRLWQLALRSGDAMGDVSAVDDDDLAIELGLEDGDEAHEFRAALVDIGFLEPNGCIHDWTDRTGKYISTRDANRDRQKKARDRRKGTAHSEPSDEDANEEAPRNRGGRPTASDWRQHPWDRTADHATGEPGMGPWDPAWYGPDFDPHQLPTEDYDEISELWRNAHSPDAREGLFTQHGETHAPMIQALLTEMAMATTLNRKPMPRPDPKVLAMGRQLRAGGESPEEMAARLMRDVDADDVPLDDAAAQ